MSKICTLAVLGFSFLSLLVSNPARAEPRVGTAPTPGFPALVEAEEVDIFSDLPDLSTHVDSLLVNGVPADRRFFPTLFRKISGQPCTAALVGPSAILMAAHCVTGNSNVRFRLRDTRIQGFCERAPGYDPELQPSGDWALCLLEFPVLDIRYETVGQTIPSVGTKVTLTGYGCTAPGGSTDGSTLRVGVAKLALRPDGLPQEASTIYTHTDVAAGGVVVCPGDSGGPLFVIPGDSFNGARTIVGVNSRSAIPEGISAFAALGSDTGHQFVKKWVERHEQKICGMNTDESCR